jgi:gliding motility-associated-like protein
VPDDCGHDTSFNLPVIPSPKAYLGKDTLLCQGGTVRLSAKDPAGITSWLWQDGATTPDYVAASPGTYTLNASNACGTSTASVQVQVATVPVVNLGMDVAICPGESMKLYNDRPRLSWDVYTWSVPSTADTITVKDGAIYWLQSENVCGKSRDSMLLTIKDSCTCFPFYARVALPDDTEMCSFDSLDLENALHTDGFRYRWQDGSTGQTLMAYGPGTYWVDVTTWCGTVRDSIVVRPKQRGCERSVNVPNAFSPSGNGSNEIFRPVITGVLSQYEFNVYNRWGQLLFHTTDRSRGWDGKINGSPQAAGVFVWSCTYRFSGQPVTSLRGTVLLVR